MTERPAMSTTRRPPGLWAGQALHFLALGVVLVLVWLVWNQLERPYPVAFWCAVAFPVVHQVFVWLAWRIELASGGTSRTIGFGPYVALFFILFGGRFVTLLALGWVDRGSLGMSTVAQVVTATVLLVPGIYAMYSVMRYFGMSRAAGADHFDAKYRSMPRVNDGIFRFTSNGMYVYAFLLFWAIAVLCNSSAALAVAAFSHAYIWVHYYATEKPDMDYLYGSQERES